MPIVDVTYYSNSADYSNEPNVGAVRPASLSVTLADLARYSVANGSFAGRPLSPKGQAFYWDLVRMALEQRGCSFLASADYLDAEPSFKAAISFYLGMIAACAVAEKVYGIPTGQRWGSSLRRLFHLGDRAYVDHAPRDGEHPDFIGVDAHGTPVMLLEAKGTVGSWVSNGTVEKAKDRQLGVVKSITVNGVRANMDNVARHVITSSFAKDSSGNHVLRYCDIDPEPDEKAGVAMALDLDAAMASYYSNVIWILDSSGTGQEVLGGRRYRTADVSGTTVGLQEDVFNALGDSGDGQFETVMRLMAESREAARGFDSALSVGPDGIMVRLGEGAR